MSKINKIQIEGIDYDIEDTTKQDRLISGTNIKTINHESILGDGNLNLEGTAVFIRTSESDDIKTLKLLSCIDGMVSYVKPVFLQDDLNNGEIYAFTNLDGNAVTNVCTFQYFDASNKTVKEIVATITNSYGEWSSTSHVLTNDDLIIYSDDESEMVVQKLLSSVMGVDEETYIFIKSCFINNKYNALYRIDHCEFFSGKLVFSYKIYDTDGINTYRYIIDTEDDNSLTTDVIFTPSSNYIIKDTMSDENKIYIITKNRNVKWSIDNNIYNNVSVDTTRTDKLLIYLIKYARYNSNTKSIESFEVTYRKEHIDRETTEETITRSEIISESLDQNITVPIEVADLTTESTSAEIIAALGGLDKALEIFEKASQGKKIILFDTDNNGFYIPVAYKYDYFDDLNKEFIEVNIILNLQFSKSIGIYKTSNNTFEAINTEKKYISEEDLNDYLSKYNTAQYTPTLDYNPATKKYVDDSIKDLIAIYSTVTDLINDNIHNGAFLSNNSVITSVFTEQMVTDEIERAITLSRNNIDLSQLNDKHFEILDNNNNTIAECYIGSIDSSSESPTIIQIADYSNTNYVYIYSEEAYELDIITIPEGWSKINAIDYSIENLTEENLPIFNGCKYFETDITNLAEICKCFSVVESFYKKGHYIKQNGAWVLIDDVKKDNSNIIKIPYDIFNLTSESTQDEIIEAFGGEATILSIINNTKNKNDFIYMCCKENRNHYHFYPMAVRYSTEAYTYTFSCFNIYFNEAINIRIRIRLRDGHLTVGVVSESETNQYVINEDLANYLSKNNTEEFTPTSDYQPATKKYVDNKYELPSTGIPKSDLSNEVKQSLEKADSALQEHQSLTNYSLVTETGNKIDLSIDSSTYVITLKLQDKNNNDLSTKTIDLPLESVVVNGRYDSASKKVILTLKNGNEIDFSIADLVSGLQSEITSTNKLSSDLISDINNTNKFVTASEKITWNSKANVADIPTKTSDLTNDSNFISSSYHDTSKQDALVSGTNIKTVNNESILGSGNIDTQEVIIISDRDSDATIIEKFNKIKWSNGTGYHNNGPLNEIIYISHAIIDDPIYCHLIHGWKNEDEQVLGFEATIEGSPVYVSIGIIDGEVIKPDPEILHLFEEKYFYSDVLTLTTSSSSKDIEEAFGGSVMLEQILDAIENHLSINLRFGMDSGMFIELNGCSVGNNTWSMNFICDGAEHSLKIGKTNNTYSILEANHKVFETATTIHTDESSTTAEITMLNNNEYRFTQPLTSLTTHFPSYDPDYISGLVFSSGSTPTVLHNEWYVVWSGDDVYYQEFTPVENKTYNIIFWYDGINLNGIVRGVTYWEGI